QPPRRFEAPRDPARHGSGPSARGGERGLLRPRSCPARGGPPRVLGAVHPTVGRPPRPAEAQRGAGANAAALNACRAPEARLISNDTSVILHRSVHSPCGQRRRKKRRPAEAPTV